MNIEVQDRQIIIRLDVMLAKRKMALNDLARLVRVHPNNLSIFKLGKGKAIRLTTLMRICTVLDCTPSDLIEFGPIVPGKTDWGESGGEAAEEI